MYNYVISVYMNFHEKYESMFGVKHALNLFFTQHLPQTKRLLYMNRLFYFYVNKLFFHSFMSVDLKTTIKHFICARYRGEVA